MTLKRAQLLIFIVLIICGPSAVVHSATDVPIEAKVKQVTGDLAFNNTITVEVENLSEYLKGKDSGPKNIILYLDWRPIKGVTARIVKNDPDKLQFDVKRTAESKDQWNALLGSPFAPNKGFSYKVNVSVGSDNQNPIKSVIKYPLIVIRSKGFWVFVGLFMLAVVVFLHLARTTAIIRDPLTLPDPSERPYSLGRTQMATWTFIVVASYIFLWMITGDFETITNSVLVLMGISASTALGAVAVDKTKGNANKSKFQKLQEESEALTARMHNLPDYIDKATWPEKSFLENEQTDKGVRLSQVDREIKDLKDTQELKKTKGFLRDMITDVDGISFHRFQICIWTIILVIVFIIAMYRNLAMPEFSPTLLTLMGISGGTYLGFKFPEIKN